MEHKYNLRGIVGKSFTLRDIKRFAKGVVDYIYKKQLSPMVILAKDNRLTGDYILSVIQAELLPYGIGVYLLGEAVTTPELVYLTKKFKFSLGIMITASHNSREYNGIKCFNKNGLPVCFNNLLKKNCRPKNYVKSVDVQSFKELYIQDLKHSINKNNFSVIFDCANGAAVYVIRKLFPKHRVIGTDISGKYINDGFGTEHIETLRAMCISHKVIGFAFDGDADRVVAVDPDGYVLDGDKILYILASQKLGAGDYVVGTQISSMALESSLNRLGIHLIRTKVGAKYVAQTIHKRDLLLGGEPCGHIFNNDSYSDGIRVAIELINILARTGKNFKELLSGYKDTYVRTADVDIICLEKVIEMDEVDEHTHTVVRKSDTENKLRIMVEGFDENIVRARHEQILQKLNI